MSRRVFVAAAVLVVLASGLAHAQNIYAFFYSRTGGQDLEVNLLNTSSSPSNYLINAYDAWGNALWEETGTLAPHDATFRTASDAIPEGEGNWGVMIVVSQERLTIGLEYSLQNRLHSIDVIGHALLIPEAGSSYRIGAYHTEVADTVTSLFVMNPWPVEIEGRLVVYGNDGAVVHQEELTLLPYESDVYNLADLAGQGSKTWGLVEVAVDDADVVLACKFLTNDVLQVKNLSAVWPISTPADSTTPEDSSPDKED